MTDFREENSEFYDLEYYISMEYRYRSGAQNSRIRNILQAAGDVRGLRALDIGCGGGFFSHEMQMRGAQATGIDYSPFAIQFAKDRFRDIDFRRMSAYELEQLPAHSYDIVTLLDVIEHMGDHDTLFRGIRHVLKPGGILVVSTDFDDSAWNHGTGKFLMKVSQLFSAQGRAYRFIKKVEAYRKQFRNYHASHIAELSYGELEAEIAGAGFHITAHRVYPAVGVPLRDWILSFMPFRWRGDHQVVVATR